MPIYYSLLTGSLFFEPFYKYNKKKLFKCDNFMLILKEMANTVPVPVFAWYWYRRYQY